MKRKICFAMVLICMSLQTAWAQYPSRVNQAADAVNRAYENHLRTRTPASLKALRSAEEYLDVVAHGSRADELTASDQAQIDGIAVDQCLTSAERQMRDEFLHASFPHEISVDCPNCEGGVCPSCNGNGALAADVIGDWVANGGDALHNVECLVCSNTGRCRNCDGAGTLPDFGVDPNAKYYAQKSAMLFRLASIRHAQGYGAGQGPQVVDTGSGEFKIVMPDGSEIYASADEVTSGATSLEECPENSSSSSSSSDNGSSSSGYSDNGSSSSSYSNNGYSSQSSYGSYGSDDEAWEEHVNRNDTLSILVFVVGGLILLFVGYWLTKRFRKKRADKPVAATTEAEPVAAAPVVVEEPQPTVPEAEGQAAPREKTANLLDKIPTKEMGELATKSREKVEELASKARTFKLDEEKKQELNRKANTLWKKVKEWSGLLFAILFVILLYAWKLLKYIIELILKTLKGIIEFILERIK